MFYRIVNSDETKSTKVIKGMTMVRHVIEVGGQALTKHYGKDYNIKLLDSAKVKDDIEHYGIMTSQELKRIEKINLLQKKFQSARIKEFSRRSTGFVVF